jgi:hypothetical protein
MIGFGFGFLTTLGGSRGSPPGLHALGDPGPGLGLATGLASFTSKNGGGFADLVWHESMVGNRLPMSMLLLFGRLAHRPGELGQVLDGHTANDPSIRQESVIDDEDPLVLEEVVHLGRMEPVPAEP